MSLTRRQFIWTTAAGWPLLLPRDVALARQADVFRHGVASGDPLADRVILWTRVTVADGVDAAVTEVQWRLASDPGLTQTVARGTVRTSAQRDFTVKVDAAGLQPGRTYYYAFEARGQRSPIGRTKTLPAAADRVRLAVACCANYPAGFFNVYRCLANRADLDAIVHVGDYIYEFENGIFGDGSALLRVPEPRREAVTLADYRVRYATYRTDPDLQEAHRQHPFIAVWDDHEMANDAWAGGAANHNPEQGEGDWAARRAAAYRAYLEWMPVRDPAGSSPRLYRAFRFGGLADLIMLDTRGLRDRQVATDDVAGLASPERTILGASQEQWLFDQLRSSQDAGTAWRLLGQQVMFARVMPAGKPVLITDTWEGYQAARDRVFDYLAADRIRDVAILSGDLHSSWAFDVPRSPWDGYQPSGDGSLAVELMAPAISSPPLFSAPGLRDRVPLLKAVLPHLKFLDGDNRGYVLLDVTASRMLAEWYFVPTVLERSDAESRAAAFVCERGSSRLVTA
ncbi:MAG: hypothetical protein A3F70_10930 [Acidobacteria bacterium RIFCSPLOWO2_12_FULL_67_14]|nr:MAG: hypothetical protein A3H29_05540 [Acidobacteria bacterium RIFCSPLOWO2_02_FULL_67_21]OFW39337.1 MAG: hypothetical protein A3F70_10930 [Acidobacteria bacterium RIFCSPLOWO2_12_FULL_67_14]